MSALDEIQAVMFRWKNMNSTTIKPTLHRRAYGRRYRLQLVEDWGSVDDAGNHMPSRNLDECVKWVEEKLKDHPDCTRQAWDMWDFKRRRDAEKFLTVFHLSWEQ